MERTDTFSFYFSSRRFKFLYLIKKYISFVIEGYNHMHNFSKTLKRSIKNEEKSLRWGKIEATQPSDW